MTAVLLGIFECSMIKIFLVWLKAGIFTVTRHDWGSLVGFFVMNSRLSGNPGLQKDNIYTLIYCSGELFLWKWFYELEAWRTTKFNIDDENEIVRPIKSNMKVSVLWNTCNTLCSHAPFSKIKSRKILDTAAEILLS